MAKQTASQSIELPVGAQFDRRLAELVWENCPELARQTAAGRIALAIDVTDKEVMKTATDLAISEAVKRLLEPLLEAASPCLAPESDRIVQEAKKLLDERLAEVSQRLEGFLSKTLEDFMKAHIAQKVQPQVTDAVRAYFQGQTIAARVAKRLDLLIDGYLKKKLKEQESGHGALIAAEAEMNVRIGEAKKETQE